MSSCICRNGRDLHVFNNGDYACFILNSKFLITVTFSAKCVTVHDDWWFYTKLTLFVLSETRPSILCVTHQISQKKKRKDPVVSAMRYEMMNSKVIPVGKWWYWVSVSWYCWVFGGAGSELSFYACIYGKKWRFGGMSTYLIIVIFFTLTQFFGE